MTGDLATAMTAKSTLTVVIGNYNHGRFLTQALSSVLGQSRKPDEVIVTDDGSTDDSRAIIAKFAAEHSCVRAIYNEKNRGIIPNANRALDMATSTYMFFGAADDYVLPGFVEKMMAAAEKYPQAGLITSDLGFLHDDGGEVVPSALPMGDSERFFNTEAIVRAQRGQAFLIGGHASLIRRDAAIEAGRLHPELSWHCDWFMNHVVAFRHGMVYVPEMLSVMRVAETTYSGSHIKSWRAQRPVLTALSNFLRENRYADVRPAFTRSGVMIIFDPLFARLALQNWSAFSLLRPITVGRMLMSRARRMQLQRLVPAWIMQVFRARARARRQAVVSSLDTHT